MLQDLGPKNLIISEIIHCVQTLKLSRKGKGGSTASQKAMIIVAVGLFGLLRVRGQLFGFWILLAFKTKGHGGGGFIMITSRKTWDYVRYCTGAIPIKSKLKYAFYS